MTQHFKRVDPPQDRYGYPLVHCPVCKCKHPENSVRMHIFHQAKSELWDREVAGKKETPHLTFYKKHTTVVRVKSIWKI